MSNILSSKILKKTLIAFVLLLSLSSWGQNKNEQVLPQALSSSSTEMKTSDKHPLEMMKGKIEDISKRTADAKHFKNKDGSYTALIGAGAMHYQKNGKWEDIDTKIKRNNSQDFPYANTSNLMESHFGASSNKGIISKTKEGEVKEFLNGKMYWEANGNAVNAQEAADVKATIDGDKIYYHNLFGKISAEYIVNVGQRKLNYIIPSKADLGNVPTGAEFLVFEEEVILPKGWSHNVTESGILLKDSKGKEIYLYEKPYSTDAANELTREKNTIFETSSTDNILKIKTKVKSSWLLSNERVFPVKVDPTTTVSPKNATNWSRSVYDDGISENAGMFGMYYPNWFRYHIKFDTSSITDTDIVVTSVIGYINFTAGTGTNPTTRQWQFANSADPTTTSGTALFNSANLGLSNIVQVVGLGQRNSSFYNNSVTNNYIRDGILSSNKAVNIAVVPTGTYQNNTYFTVANHTSANRPYLVINWQPVSSDRTLIVSNAYTGASHANGSHTIANNTNITANSGTRAGYNVTGWTGTGSVPATGTGDTANFTITQNSSISWIWEQLAVKNLQFHNYGGTEQLSFNNSRIDTNTPKFRLSHQAEEANEYQIEINTNPTFSGGTNWVQNFTGTFNTNTESNFTITNAFSPSNNTTYYVRARAKASVNNEWSNWTTETYSFTYQTPKTNPDWFQTTEAQFQSNSLSGVIADASHDVVIPAVVNRITNGSFETNLNGWTEYKTYNFTSTRNNEWATDGSWNMMLHDVDANYFSGDYVTRYQQIDFTDLSTIMFDSEYYSFAGAYNVELRVYASELSNSKSLYGDVLLYTWRPSAKIQEVRNATINLPLNLTGIKNLKFVYYAVSQELGISSKYISLDNIRTFTASAGTITSTPIHLASVQEATAYQGITWNQSLGGGTLALKVQSSTDGVNFSDIAGYTNITQSGDGEKFFDLSELTPAPPHLRLVGTLDGQNVKMHDWAVAFVKELPCDKTWTGATSTDWHTTDNWLPIGVPTNKNCVNIPNTLNKPVVSSLATAFAQSLELQEFANLKILSGASISIKNEITNHGDESNFVIEDTGSLVQEENLSNTGTITYNRNTAQAWAKDFIYLGSPVSNAQFSQISNEPGKNFGAFYHWLSSPTPGEAGKWSSAIAGNSVNTMTAAQGYIARVPNNWTAATIYKMNFKGIPNNGDITIPFKTGTRQDVVSTSDVNEAYQDKWVLLANPYPSAIDALEMLNLQSNKDLLFDSGNPSNPYNSDGALYFWNHKDGTGAMQNPFYNNGTNYSSDPSNHYIVKNFTGTTPIETPINNSPSGNWNGKIPAAQAFFIRGKENADGHFSFTNSMRVTGENDSYYKNNEKHRFWLDLTKKDNNKSAQTLIGYVDGASNGLDFMYDGLSMDNDLDIYTNIMGKNLSIQGRSLPFDSQDIVTLGYTAPQTGAYRIGLFQTEGLFAPHGIQTIYLKDKSNGILHNLIDAPYEFVTDTGRYNDRFEIVYEKTTLTTENIQKTQLNIIYDDLQKRWLILSPQHRISKIEIYDLSGKLIWIKKAINTTAFSIPYRHVNQKTALIKVHTDNVEVVTKKIINP